MRNKLFHNLSFILIAVIFLTACGQGAEQPSSEGELKVVATTTIVGDVVDQVGADLIDLSVLLPIGTDPHSFDPTPQDVAKVAEADVVFANGAGLEEFLDNLIESADAEDKVVHVSEGIDLLIVEDDAYHEEDIEHEGEEHDEDHEGEVNHHEGADPHTWLDPNNVMIWVHNIEQELSKLDPSNAGTYEVNAEKYEAELTALDAWIREQVALIPEENRELVTDHTLFSYFAKTYGFRQIGALIPGYSSLSEPTAQDLAEIEDAIKDLGVKAVFVGNTVNPALAERVTEDTGTSLVFVYTGSLSDPGGEADTYIDYIRYNINAFVDALK
jgi:manganese/iron transport system substrate-binding protein